MPTILTKVTLRLYSMQVAAMEQLQREKAEAAAAVRRLEGELAAAVSDREVARVHTADLESRLAGMDRLRGERSAALGTVQRLEVEAAAAAASLAAAMAQVAALEDKAGPRGLCFRGLQQQTRAAAARRRWPRWLPRWRPPWRRSLLWRTRRVPGVVASGPFQSLKDVLYSRHRQRLDVEAAAATASLENMTGPEGLQR